MDKYKGAEGFQPNKSVFKRVRGPKNNALDYSDVNCKNSLSPHINPINEKRMVDSLSVYISKRQREHKKR